MIVTATWEDALAVSLNMREEDMAEVMATRWNDSPYDFAADCMRLPGVKLAAINKEGRSVAIGGVATHSPGVGQAWLVGTHEIGELGVEIAHACRKSIKTLFNDGLMHRIQAFSAETHTQAHEWLRLIGLTDERPMPKYGKNGEGFICFAITRGD